MDSQPGMDTLGDRDAPSGSSTESPEWDQEGEDEEEEEEQEEEEEEEEEDQEEEEEDQEEEEEEEDEGQLGEMGEEEEEEREAATTTTTTTTPMPPPPQVSTLPAAERNYYSEMFIMQALDYDEAANRPPPRLVSVGSPSLSPTAPHSLSQTPSWTLTKSSWESAATSESQRGFPEVLDALKKDKSGLDYHSFRTVAKTLKAVQIAVQTDQSWLQQAPSQRHKSSLMKKLLYEKIPEIKTKPSMLREKWVINPEEAKLNILCQLEFQEDFASLMESPLRTLPSIGPPRILAFRPELGFLGPKTKEKDEELELTCEFCGRNLKDLFTTVDTNLDTASLEPVKSSACCGYFRSLLDYIFEDQKTPELELIAIGPHAAHGTEAERIKAKEKALQRKVEQQFARQYAMIVKADQHTAADEDTRHAKISYQLSMDSQVKEKEEESLCDKLLKNKTISIVCCDTIIAGGKTLNDEFWGRNYKHGSKFLTFFPDGTMQIFYPSGNLAIIRVPSKNNGYTCIIQEDAFTDPAILAVLNSCGRITCYHPNGNVWVCINLLGGQYSDPAGNRVRIWSWATPMTPVPFASFKPVFLALNHNVGVRILEQDNITITFLAMGQQARISVGTRVQLLKPKALPPLHSLSEDDLLLLAVSIKARRLFHKLEGCSNFPSSLIWEKQTPPPYLSTLSLRLIALCHSLDITEETVKTIATIINEDI